LATARRAANLLAMLRPFLGCVAVPGLTEKMARQTVLTAPSIQARGQ
jgi:hypothetical protein